MNEKIQVEDEVLVKGDLKQFDESHIWKGEETTQLAATYVSCKRHTDIKFESQIVSHVRKGATWRFGNPTGLLQTFGAGIIFF